MNSTKQLFLNNVKNNKSKEFKEIPRRIQVQTTNHLNFKTLFFYNEDLIFRHLDFRGKKTIYFL